MVLRMTQVPRIAKLCALMWDELPPAGGSWRWALALAPEHWGCEVCPSEVLWGVQLLLLVPWDCWHEDECMFGCGQVR